MIKLLTDVDKTYHVIWLRDFLCHDGWCASEIDGKFIYADRGHLTHEGSALIGRETKLYSLITDSTSQSTARSNTHVHYNGS